MKRLGANQSEMEFIAALRWSVEEVSRAFGVPKVFLERVRGCDAGECANDGAVLVAEHDHPGVEDAGGRDQSPVWCRTSRGFAGELIVRFNLSDVEAIQESQSDRAERLATLVGAGIMSAEEARGELEV